MIPFSPPRIDQKILDEVCAALRSGWITTGPRTKEFEQKLSEYCGSRNTLCVSAATHGMELMLRWFGVQEGDEVIVPVYTYCATANVVVHCGAKVVFVDTCTDFNISVNEIRKAITERTKVIMPVDISGFPCDHDEINALVREPGISDMFEPRTDVQDKLGRILVLSDAAHSVGAMYKGKRTGSLTDVSVFSFHAVKNLSTAEGGAIALNLPDQFDCDAVYQTLNIRSLHGQDKDALAKVQKGGWRYDVVDAGYKCNMTDIQAAMGLVELARYDSETLKRRREIFDLYNELLVRHEWAQLPFSTTEEKTSSYHIYLLRIKNVSEEQRDAIIQRIFKQDVAVNVHFQPVPMLSFYKGLGYDVTDYPVAYDNYQREITLPCYYDLSDKDVRKVVEVVVTAIDQELA